MLLAIDSSAGTSVAVVDDAGRVLGIRASDDTRRHAEVVGEAIAGALADAGVAPRQVTRVAVGMGPGPFTGLRVGIVAARSFAFGVGARVLPVVSHDAIALDESGEVLVVTDARRRELAWSVHRDGVRVEGPALARADALAEAVPGYPALRRIDAATVDAGRLGRLAVRMDAEGAAFAGEQPLYLRAPDVTLSTPKRVRT